MGFLDRITDSFRTRDKESGDYYLDDDFDDSEYYEDDYEAEPAPRKPFGLGRSQNKPQQNGGGVRSLFPSTKVTQIPETNMEVTVKKPTNLNDSRSICDDLLEGRAVVINLEGIDTATAQRIIDFTLGAVYSIAGDLQSISKYIFIASPHSVELSGDFTGDFARMNSGAEPKGSRSTGFAFNG